MSLIDFIVVVQMMTFGALAVLFGLKGLNGLAFAQLCYLGATVALFLGKG